MHIMSPAWAIRGAAPLAAACLLASGGSAWAAPTSFGSGSFQSVRTCSGLADEVDCMGPTNPDLTRKETFILGGEGIAIDSDITPQTGGRIVSRVQFGDLDLPIIKSGAWAGVDNRVASTITTYMGFAYEGDDAVDYALDALIDWNGSGAPLRDANGGAGEFGGEGIGGFTLWLMDAASFPTIGQIVNLFDFTNGLNCDSAGVLGTSFLNLGSAAGPGSGAITLSAGCDGSQLQLAPGGEYVLISMFQTVANRDGFMDATNTITVQLSETLPDEVRQQIRENVVTARSLVPEPASWAMMIAGFGLVGAVARRKRSVGLLTA